MSILWAALRESRFRGLPSGGGRRGSFVWIMFIESFLEGPAPHVARFLPVHAWIAVIV